MEERSPAPQNSLELQPTGARRRISGVTAAQPAAETPAPETPPPGSSGEQGGQASLERRRARLAALQSCEFADLRIDRVKAAMLVLAVLPRLQRLRPQVEELLARRAREVHHQEAAA